MTTAPLAGPPLRPIIMVKDDSTRGEQAMDIVVTARRLAPPVAEAPPIAVSLTPSPIERVASLTVIYTIVR